MLWNHRRGGSREAATAASAHSKRYEFPERLFTLLELAVVQRERSVFFWPGAETCAGSVQAKNVRRKRTGGDVRRKRTGEEHGT